MNKVAIDEDVLNWLNFIGWLIDLELITYEFMCKRGTYENAICMCVYRCIFNNKEGN